MSDIQLKYKSDFSRAQHYWDALWEHEIIDRPCAVVWAKGKNAANEAPRTVAVEADFGEVFELHDRYLSTNHFLGECMPGFRPGFGPDQFAGFLGAPLVMSDNSSDTSWSQKIVEVWKSFLPLKIDKKGRCWNRMKEFHAAATDYFKGKCLLYNPDLHSNIDALEGLRGAEKLLFDILDAPDVVLEAMRQVCKLHSEIFNEFYRYGDKTNLGTTSWLHFYCRGKYGVIQSDFICLLTPEMFRTFVLPAIEEEAQFFDRSCFHLDGIGALTHLDDILAIRKIDAIQWVPGEGNKPQLEWMDLLHKIQTAGKIIILYGSIDQIKDIHGEFNPEQLVYEVQAQTKEEGMEFLEWLMRNT